MNNNKNTPLIIKQHFVNLSLVIYPATVLIIGGINGLLTGIMALTGIWVLLKNKNTPFNFSRDEKLLFITLVIFFLTSQVSTLSTGLQYGVTGKFLHLLLAIPIYVFLKSTRINRKALWYGLVSGSIASAIIACYEVWFTNSPRADGITNPIIFGDLALVMGALSLAGLDWFRKHSNLHTLLPVTALILGMLASLLSLSRGAWISIPFLLILFVWHAHITISRKNKIISSSLLFVFLASIYYLPQTGVQDRVKQTVNNFSSFLETDIDDPDRETSVARRIEMWQAAMKIYIDNPLIGVGWENYTKETLKLADQGLMTKSAADYPHPHNQFLSHMAKGGTLNLISILAIFIIPGWIFYRATKYSKHGEIQQIAFAGLVLVISFACFGLSEAIFERSRPVNFYAFYLAVFFAAIHGEKEKT